jgi:Na+-transporting NADH:ubiquinone oxidoreductase subunit B
MAIVGIVFGVTIGKTAFGGFGQNVFNPAMVGRCSIYITFPIHMTNRWVDPIWGGLAGIAHWSPPADAITRATPMVELRQGVPIPFEELFFGNTAGCLGETSAFLILLGGAYIVFKKAAPWRIALSCLLGGIALSGILHWLGYETIQSPFFTLLSGSFLFGCAFVATEPISGAKTREGQFIYGFFIGGLTVIFRGFSNFSEGIMFAVLLMNAFVPILDQAIRQIKTSKKANT